MNNKGFLLKRFFCFCVFLSFFSFYAFRATLAVEGGVKMKLSSPDFQPNQMMPSQFTCQGQDINPVLDIADIPDGTKSLVLIMDDPDAPMGTWVHWVVYDMVPQPQIKQGEVPGVQGINSFRRLDYGGPCPPSGTHRYFFKLYALDRMLGLPEGVTKKDVIQAMEGHILDQADLVGLYKKK